MSQYCNITLSQLISKIKQSELALPHIQRNFVWDQAKVSKLMDSLIKDYPLQPFMFWKTKEQVKVRKFQCVIDEDVELSSLYDANKSNRTDLVKELVLDGQQRIQSLYAVFVGGYLHNGRDEQIVYFNVADDGEIDGQDRFVFSVKSPGLIEDNAPEPCWLEVRTLIDMSDSDAELLDDKICKQIDTFYTDNPKTKFKKPSDLVIRKNVRRLDSLLRKKLYSYILLDGTTSTSYPLKRVLDIFVRVNSGSVKLEPTELMFATLKGGWPEAEQEIDDVKTMLNDKGSITLDFDNDIILRCLSLAYANTCIVNEKSFQDLETMKIWCENWSKADESFKRLNDLIAHDLQLYSPKMVPGYSAFMPIFSYLYERFRRDSTGLTLDEKRDIFAFYYTAQVLGWFSSQTDSKVNKLNATIRKAHSRIFPFNDILKVVGAELRRPTQITVKDLNNKSRRSIVLNLAYVVANNSSPFKVASRSNKPDIDHIYPRKLLLDLFKAEPNKFTEKDILEEINHIGNFRLIGATENRKRKDIAPDTYFLGLKEKGFDISRHILVDPYCSDPSLMKSTIDDYRKFRDARANKMLELINAEIAPKIN